MTVEKIPTYLAVGAFVCICVGVAHEWAYFGVIGKDLQSSMSYSDYFAEFIVLIGPAFIFMVVIAAIQFAAYRADNFVVPQEKTKWGQTPFEWFIFLASLLGAIVSWLFFDESQRFPVYAFLALFTMRLTFYVLEHEKFRSVRKSLSLFLLCMVPTAMIVFYGAGRDAAHADLKERKSQYIMRIKGVQNTQHVNLLRLMEAGAIAYDPSSKKD